MLSEYYNSTKRGDEKFAPDKFRPKINKITLKFEKQLKRNNATGNVVCEIKLLRARSKYALLKIKEIVRPMLSKIENLNKDNNTELLIKECY